MVQTKTNEQISKSINASVKNANATDRTNKLNLLAAVGEFQPLNSDSIDIDISTEDCTYDTLLHFDQCPTPDAFLADTLKYLNDECYLYLGDESYWDYIPSACDVALQYAASQGFSIFTWFCNTLQNAPCLHHAYKTKEQWENDLCVCFIPTQENYQVYLNIAKLAQEQN